MSQDDILQSTKSVIQGLDALKNEHGTNPVSLYFAE